MMRYVNRLFTYLLNNNNNNQDNAYYAVSRVHPVRLMNVEWRQVATDPRPSQTTSLLITVRKTAKLHFVNCKLKV